MDIEISREELKQEYGVLILNNKAQIEQFEARCLHFLEKNPVKDCFKLLPLPDIQKDFLKKNEDTEFQHLIKAIQIFEKYAARILAKPWCKDLYTIKVYTGFFKYNIEQWLSSDIVYSVFKLIGYEQTSIGTLTLETSDFKNRALLIGFELFLAHTQLHLLKTTENLSPKYPMENIFEGWFNTTGSVNKIYEWLATNRSTMMEKSIERSTLGSDDPDETLRSKSVTIESETLRYDENGYTMVQHSVKYPPSCSKRHDYSTNGDFTSLPTCHVSDVQLYGDSSDYTEPPPPRSGSESDYFDNNTIDSKPLAFTNKLHEYEQNRDFKKTATREMRKYASNPRENFAVVSRGGSSIRANEYQLYENITTSGTNILKSKQIVDQILASRREKGEKTSRLSPQNRNLEARKIGDDHTTPTGVYEDEMKYERDLENNSTDDIQPGQETLFYSNTLSNPTNNFTKMEASYSCYLCGKPPEFQCEACDKFTCNDCFSITSPCCENAKTFSSCV